MATINIQIIFEGERTDAETAKAQILSLFPEAKISIVITERV